MKSCLIGVSFLRKPEDVNDQERIQSNWNISVTESLVDPNNEFSGDVGMLGGSVATWYSEPITSRKGAEDFLARTHCKGNRAIAVSYSYGNKSYWLIGGWYAGDWKYSPSE